MTITKTDIAHLQAVLPKLAKSSDQKFGADLIHAFHKYGKLTPKQEPWVVQLIARAENPAPAPKTVEVGGFAGVISLFKTAKEHLKFPKVVLVCEGQKIILSLAGPTSKVPGSVNIAGEGKYPNRQWFGRVSPDGQWMPAPSMTPQFQSSLQTLLQKFAANPSRIAKEYGKLTGHCCFCNLQLTDPRSTAVGYGPICADHYGLKEAWKSAADKFDAVQEVPQLDQPVATCFLCETAPAEEVHHGEPVCLACAEQLYY